MDAVLLPIDVPLIRTGPQAAGLLSVIGQFQRGRNWIHNNYILLEAYSIGENNRVWLNFRRSLCWETCPLVSVRHWRKSEVGSDVCEFIRDHIARGCYVIVTLDNYFVPIRSWAYYKVHFNHDTLVRGFDGNSFYVSDFHSYDKHVQERIGDREMRSAIRASLKESRRNLWRLEGRDPGDLIAMTAKVSSLDGPEISLRDIHCRITDYIRRRNCCWHVENELDRFYSPPLFDGLTNADGTQQITSEDLRFGLGVYDVLSHYIDNVDLGEDSMLDWQSWWKPFFVVAAHKSLMVSRYDVLVERNVIRASPETRNELATVANVAGLLCKLGTMYEVTRDSTVRNRLARCAERLRSLETTALRGFCRILENGS